ncbi:MAG: hypothetical protein GQ535_14405 [Rhodobacteraceae bacterium]|nr:hypothetical protein [Paracoccaceae bacterium]
MKQQKLKAAALALALLPSAGFSQGCISDQDRQNVTVVEGGQSYQTAIVAGYIADITARDMSNSRGVRLNNFGAILQQDRANVHKTGVLDSSDGFTEMSDSYFTSAARRAVLSAGPYYFECAAEHSADYSEALKDYIESGQVPGFIGVNLFRESRGGLAIFIWLMG